MHGFNFLDWWLVNEMTDPIYSDNTNATFLHGFEYKGIHIRDTFELK